MKKDIAKKLRKYARKEVNAKYQNGLILLKSMIRPKPKYCPKFLWILFYLPIFKKNTIRHIYKSLE